ncbi:glycosyltransferase [Pelagibacterales bacterium SAG-MED07]|nr:glycosyltransferase [Pelagibacterales bacterium SAG-MED07]
MNEKITIILLSHKSQNLIINFVKKIYKKFQIIIIDNSNDLNLKEIINKEYPKIFIDIINNNGYGAAINHAAKMVQTKYFLISNPDIENLDEEKIIKFENVAKKLNDDFATLGPRYENLNSKSIKQTDINQEISEMKFLSGACMFFKKKTFDILKGFDENFFLYFEESDFCLRASKLYKNYQVNSIKVNHNVGTSVSYKNEEEKNEFEKLYTWHFIWSKFYYFKKHYGFIFAILYFMPIIIRINFRIILYGIKKDNINLIKYKTRKSGLYSSILNQKSSKRI